MGLNDYKLNGHTVGAANPNGHGWLSGFKVQASPPYRKKVCKSMLLQFWVSGKTTGEMTRMNIKINLLQGLFAALTGQTGLTESMLLGLLFAGKMRKKAYQITPEYRFLCLKSVPAQGQNWHFTLPKILFIFIIL